MLELVDPLVGLSSLDGRDTLLEVPADKARGGIDFLRKRLAPVACSLLTFGCGPDDENASSRCPDDDVGVCSALSDLEDMVHDGTSDSDWAAVIDHIRSRLEHADDRYAALDVELYRGHAVQSDNLVLFGGA